MDITCGVFIINDQFELLLVHPTNAHWNSWSIPKGLVEENENFEDAAIREVLEETNIDLNSFDTKLIFAGEEKYRKRNKKLRAFVSFISGKHDFDLKCESKFQHNKTGEWIPENDKIEWVPIYKAKELIHETQLKILNDISKSI